MAASGPRGESGAAKSVSNPLKVTLQTYRGKGQPKQTFAVLEVGRSETVDALLERVSELLGRPLGIDAVNAGIRKFKLVNGGVGQPLVEVLSEDGRLGVCSSGDVPEGLRAGMVPDDPGYQ
jgi:hypothetical protein